MQIYYARGNEVNDSKYESFIKSLGLAYEELTDEDCKITQHNRLRSGYNPQLLTGSDCVVMVTAYPEENRLQIGVGLYQEIYRACENNIPVYVLSKKTNSSITFLYRIDDTMLTVVRPELWTAGHAIIDLSLAIDMWDVHNEFNMKNFWRVQMEYKGFNTKPESKGGDKQNKDLPNNLLLLG